MPYANVVMWSEAVTFLLREARRQAPTLQTFARNLQPPESRRSFIRDVREWILC